jgi:hypothetical protein
MVAIAYNTDITLSENGKDSAMFMIHVKILSVVLMCVMVGSLAEMMKVGRTLVGTVGIHLECKIINLRRMGNE